MEHLPFHVMHLSERVNLKPHQLDNAIEQHVAQAAQHKLEGRCSKYGFIRPNSVVVISRSVGQHKGSHFHGELTYDVEVVADVCRPLRGDQIFCTVVNLNKMGLLAKAGELSPDNKSHVLQIYVVLQHHNNAEFFDDPNLTEGASICVSVIGSKFKLKDDKIIVIGKMMQVYGTDVLHDYEHKIVRLPIADSSSFDPLFESSAEMPDARTAFGYELYVETLKSLLGTAQQDLKDKLKCLESGSEIEDEMYLDRKWGRLCVTARSLTNEFELVSPPYSYEPSPPVVMYRPLDRAFYKMWEMIEDFKLLDEASSDRIVTAHAAECPGSFAEAILKHRELKSSVTDDTLNVSDQVFVMSLKRPTESSPGTPHSDTITRLTDKYPNVTVIYGGEQGRPCPTGFKKRQGDGTGDLFKTGNILDFSADVQSVGGAYIVTSDLGFDFDKVEAIREQCMLFPIFSEMSAILACQKKGGHCVLKLFDIFTKTTAKLIAFFTAFYQEAYVTKPYTSRSGNPEKYLVCKYYKGINKKQLADVWKMSQDWKAIEKHVGAQYPENTQFVVDLPGITAHEGLFDALLRFNHVNVSQRQVRTLASTIRVLRRDNVIPVTEMEAIKDLQTRSAKAWYAKYMPRNKLTTLQQSQSEIPASEESGSEDSASEQEADDPTTTIPSELDDDDVNE